MSSEPSPSEPTPRPGVPPPIVIQSLTRSFNPRPAPPPSVPMPVHTPTPAAEIHAQDPDPVFAVNIALPATVQRRPNVLAYYWRTIGGGSLLMSLLIHGIIVVVALFLIVQGVTKQTGIDFLPGGGASASGAEKSMSYQVKQNRQKVLREHMPVSRVVSISQNATISLPETPLESISLPESSPLMSGGMLSTGMGTGGSGGGFGKGQGIGGANGFVASTLWGRNGADGLKGIFYDLKQDPERNPTGFVDGEGTYATVVNKAASKHFDTAAMKGFYQSKQPMIFNFMLIPNIPAEDGPKSFNMEKEVQPRDWFIHYSGLIMPPTPGDYRFVGFFDDLLVVYINDKPVLDASWYSLVRFGQKPEDTGIRSDFGGPPISGARRAYFGKWLHMEGTTKIDIVVGERPGGRCGGLLLIQQKNATYQTRPDGTPILPLFCTVKPDVGDITRIKRYSTITAFALAENMPIFTVRKPMFPARN